MEGREEGEASGGDAAGLVAGEGGWAREERERGREEAVLAGDGGERTQLFRVGLSGWRRQRQRSAAGAGRRRWRGQAPSPIRVGSRWLAVVVATLSC